MKKFNKITDIFFYKYNKYEYLNFIGLHFHIGTQILNFKDNLLLCNKIDEIIQKFNFLGINITYLNLGGGLGVDYENPKKNPIPDFKVYFRTYLNNIKSLKKISEYFNGSKSIKLHFELGRSIICQFGNLISKVNYIKQEQKKNL